MSRYDDTGSRKLGFTAADERLMNRLVAILRAEQDATTPPPDVDTTENPSPNETKSCARSA